MMVNILVIGGLGTWVRSNIWRELPSVALSDPEQKKEKIAAAAAAACDVKSGS